MKLFLYALAALVVIIGVVLFAYSLASRKQPELGLVDGRLQPCPGTPNCVCSEYQVEGAYVEPLGYDASAESAWIRLKRVVADTGGEVIAEDDGYLRAIYRTPLIRYIDDVEFRLDASTPVIHVRSASRVGKSDLGANRKRVEKIRAAFGR
jgi:uncharacterized protein (DUF1499 family)